MSSDKGFEFQCTLSKQASKIKLFKYDIRISSFCFCWCEFIYSVLLHNNFSSTSTLLFSEMRGQFISQKIKEKKRKTEGRKEEKILEKLEHFPLVSPSPLLKSSYGYEGLGPSLCAHVKVTLIFKMATAERREARRRKLLQNSENRLNRILGSRSSNFNTSQPQSEKDESVSQNNSVESDGVSVEREVLNGGERADKVLKDKTIEMEPSEGVSESKCLERKRFMDTEVRPPSAVRDLDSTPQNTEQGEEGNFSKTASNTGSWRVVLNVMLAFMLVIHWFYVNLEALLSLSGKERTENSPVKHSVQSQVR